MLTKVDGREGVRRRETEGDKDGLWICQIMRCDNRKHSVVFPVLQMLSETGVNAAYSDTFQHLNSEER